MTGDLRTISAAERRTLRIRALGEIEKSKNISKVSRDLGIDRQVLHRWVNRSGGVYSHFESRRGRSSKQRLSLEQIHHILEILALNLPADLGIDSIFWSVSSVLELISKTLRMQASAYLVRKWLLEWGFFFRRPTDILQMVLTDSQGLSIREYAKALHMPCYVFWRSYIRTHVTSRHFQCISSERGDLRFVGDKCESVRRADLFLSKVHKTARKNIVVAYDENCTMYGVRVRRISEGVILFRKSKGKLKVLDLTESQHIADIFAFLED